MENCLLYQLMDNAIIDEYTQTYLRGDVYSHILMFDMRTTIENIIQLYYTMVKNSKRGRIFSWIEMYYYSLLSTVHMRISSGKTNISNTVVEENVLLYSREYYLSNNQENILSLSLLCVDPNI